MGEARHKNALLILVDQWRGDCLSSLGHPVVKTPFLDDLAKDGFMFGACYAQAPSCIPARACLATGKSPYGCGRIGYSDKIPWTYDKTLMHGFRDAGYQTINVGKTHFYPQRNHLGFEINELYDPQRLDAGFISDYHAWLEKETRGSVKDPAMEWSNNSWVALPWQGDDEYHPSQWTVSKAQELLNKRDTTRPFFMQLSFHRPHPPYDAPEFYTKYYEDEVLPEPPIGSWAKGLDKKTVMIDATSGRISDKQSIRMRKAYYASITHVDHMIGRMLHWLKEHDLYSSTTVVFVSDHGELLGDHYMYRKVTPFEGSARIPLIIKPGSGLEPKIVQPNEVVASHFDILPTLYNLMDIELPGGVEGMDLFHPIEREFIHGEHTGYGQEGWHFLTNGKWKYIYETYSAREWYFDLSADPKELNNQIQSESSTKQKRIDACRRALIERIEKRPEYGFVHNHQLTTCPRMPDYLAKKS